MTTIDVQNSAEKTNDNIPRTLPQPYTLAGTTYRFIAGMIDFILLITPTIFSGIFARTFVKLGLNNGVETIILLSFVAAWFYFVGFESSHLQATPGKMLMQIKVADLKGNRISIPAANARFWGKVVSIMFLFLGFLIIPFTPKKQGFQDFLAKTIVINK